MTNDWAGTMTEGVNIVCKRKEQTMAHLKMINHPLQIELSVYLKAPYYWSVATNTVLLLDETSILVITSYWPRSHVCPIKTTFTNQDKLRSQERMSPRMIQ